MSMAVQTQAKAAPTIKPVALHTQSGLLQRACACGGTPGVDGECAECRGKRLQRKAITPLMPLTPTLPTHQGLLQRCSAEGECAECRAKRLGLQRSAAAPATSSSAVPPIVHEVLGSPGHSLDAGTRAFMEPRFGHDFSNVRVHTDTKAAESARAVNALAYTVGRDMVFGTGQYASGTSAGMKLMAHELTHVVQQSQGQMGDIEKMNVARVNNPGDTYEQEADQTSDVVLKQSTLPTKKALSTLTQLMIQRACPPARTGIGATPSSEPCTRRSPVPVSGDKLLFCQDSTELLDGQTDWLNTITTEAQKAARIEIHGNASIEGPQGDYNFNLACKRAATVAKRLKASGVTVPMTLVSHGPTTVYGSEWSNRNVIVVLVSDIVVKGIACPCDKATEKDYDVKTLHFLISIEPLITSIAGSKGIPTVAVAGAIADEFNTQRGLRGTVDSVQDAVVGALPESFISVDRFFDIHAKLLNTLENDIGPANIKVRTALELVQKGELTVQGSPPSDIAVNRIVASLLTERGTVEATTAVIAKAQKLFGPYLTEHGDDLKAAVLVEYFKQGDKYFNRFLQALKADPNHKICPGDGGCQFWHNIDRIQRAINWKG